MLVNLTILISYSLETIEESVGSLFSLMDVTEEDNLIDTTRKSSRRHRGSKEKRSSSETRHSSKKKKIEVLNFCHNIKFQIKIQFH